MLHVIDGQRSESEPYKAAKRTLSTVTGLRDPPKARRPTLGPDPPPQLRNYLRSSAVSKRKHDINAPTTGLHQRIAL
ncbi:hypothetical protein Hypma_003900 [Hypsizygus marmoreus]|uniref:Uncharacterized protein n=1 Tax=Hypsizygus marmoreus TaxID=39966 RepID=A0A369K1V5_HYPMA|nr:hypothetical protein Hypma_003900 [Hypsizygus marmoreus]